MKKKLFTSGKSNVVTFLYIPGSLIFYEILLFFLSGNVFNFGNFAAMLLVSLAGGTVLTILSSLSSSSKLNGWIAFVFLELECIIFMLFFFVQQTYDNFINVATIFSGAKGILKEFGSTIIDLITHNIGTILLFEIPVLLFVLLCLILKVFQYQKLDSRTLRFLLISFCILEAAAIGLTLRNQNNRIKLAAQYDFNTVVRCFNLQTALKVDLSYLVLGNPKSNEFLPQQQSADIDPALCNMMEIDFQTLAEETQDSRLANMHRYVAGLTPSEKNAYTGLCRGKNLVFLTVEAMSAEMITEEATPNLYRLSQEGIVFEDYYQPYWNGSTSTGEFSNLLGIIPTQAMYSYENTKGKNLYFTIGNVLMREGYFSRAYHNGTAEYYDRNLLLPNFGYEKFIANGSGMEGALSGNWPESDLEMMQFAVPQFIDQTPFSTYFMTLSGHFPYFHDLSIMVEKYEDRVSGAGYSDFVEAYICSEIDLDEAVGYLLAELKKAGLYDDTVIVLAPDHYPYGLTESDAWGTDQNYLPELYGYEPETMMERDHNALIIWSADLEAEGPVVVSEPSYSVDILPTLLNLYGAEFDSRLLAGRDVLSDTDALVIWPDYSWLTTEGSYDALSDVFTPSEGSSADEEYIQKQKAIVRNKMTFSTNVLALDYYDELFGK